MNKVVLTLSARCRDGILLGWLLMAGASPSMAYAQTTMPSSTDSEQLAAVDADPQLATAPDQIVRQSTDDAWWTGPMLANSAGTLPPGHILVEPYWYDIHSAHADSYGSRAYMLYGLADRLTVGIIPIIGYNTVQGGPNASGVGIGDFTVQAQYQLTRFHADSWVPMMAVAVQETFPTGRYDKLGNRPADGLGAGAYTTTLQFNTQTYFWLPNGRILRMRFNLEQSFSGHADLQGVSVYGTGQNFRGYAKPGNDFSVDAAWEYSVTRSWVLALDVTYNHSSNTPVLGNNIVESNALPYMAPVRSNSGNSTAFGVAPAIEYNWNANVGVLFGTRVIFGGHNTVSTVTPALALNYVY